MTTSQSDSSSFAVLTIAALENRSKREVACTYRGMQGKRLIIESNETVPTNTPVTLQHEDALYLGDVVSCSTLAASQIIEIRVSQILSGLQSLLSLRSQLIGSPVQNAVGVNAVGAVQ